MQQNGKPGPVASRGFSGPTAATRRPRAKVSRAGVLLHELKFQLAGRISDRAHFSDQRLRVCPTRERLPCRTMIKCKECGCEYLSIWKEGYPGGAETGATILVWGIGQMVFGLVLWIVAFIFGFRILHLFGPLFLLMGILRIASITDNRRAIIEHGGNICPNCGTSNELHWYN